MAVVEYSAPSLEINEPVAVERWAHTQSKLNKINFRWTINNFSFRHQKIESPTFSSYDNDEIKWCLESYPNAVEEQYKDYMSIYLKLIKPCDKPVLGKCKLSILNSELKKSEMKSYGTRNFQQSDTWGFPNFIKREFLLDESKDLLPGDKLTIFCEVSFVTDSINISSQKGIGQFKIPECKLTDDFRNLLDSLKLSDVTLIAGEHEFPAHKAILAARSDVFSAMFEHEMEEKKLNMVVINDVDHEVIQEMLRFIYTGAAPKLKEMADQLLAAADKYALRKLKVMCEEMLFTELSIETAAETLVLADLHSADQLRKETIQFIGIHAREIIKTKGWEKMWNPNVNFLPLLTEVIEALLRPPKQREDIF